MSPRRGCLPELPGTPGQKPVTGARRVQFTEPVQQKIKNHKGGKKMEIKRILWPTDFSENASRALPLVTSLSQQYGAEIHILYVMKDYPEFGAHYGDFDPQEKETMHAMEKEMAEKRLTEICDKFLNECPLYIRHIAVGEPAQVILDFVTKETIDLVVLASRGSESHFDFGSVADRVIKCTTVPVVIVPV
jgi:nucleotide-binding universal stress UspA family protein